MILPPPPCAHDALERLLTGNAKVTSVSGLDTTSGSGRTRPYVLVSGIESAGTLVL